MKHPEWQVVPGLVDEANQCRSRQAPLVNDLRQHDFQREVKNAPFKSGMKKDRMACLRAGCYGVLYDWGRSFYPNSQAVTMGATVSEEECSTPGCDRHPGHMEVCRVPTKQRVGDQPLPKGGQVCVQDLVIAEMIESKRVGEERYGSPLMTFNGRRSIKDVAEEARDLHVYLTQVLAEADSDRDTLVLVAAKAIEEAIAREPDVHLSKTRCLDLAVASVDAIMGWVVGTKMGNAVE